MVSEKKTQVKQEAEGKKCKVAHAESRQIY